MENLSLDSGEQRADAGSLSIKDLFFKYIRFLPLFVLSAALGLMGAYLYLRYATPIYQSSGSIIIRSDKNASGNDEKLTQLMQGETQVNLQSEVEFLRSRQLMERVVADLGLNWSYQAIGKVKDMDVYAVTPFHIEALSLKDSGSSFSFVFSFLNAQSFQLDNSGSNFSYGQTFSTPQGSFRLIRTKGAVANGQYKVSWAPTSTVAAGLVQSLIIAPKAQGTNILTISLQSTSPQLAADVLNRLMLVYGLARVEERNASNQRTKAFVDERVREVRAEVDSVAQIQVAFLRANNISNLEAQGESSLGRKEETDKAIYEQNTQLFVVNSIYNYLTHSQNNFEAVPSSLTVADATLNTMISAYNVAQLERKTLLNSNVPRGNVRIQRLEADIEKLRRNILENLRNIKSTYSSNIAELRSQNAAAEAEVRAMPAKQKRALEIQRELESKLSTYNFLREEQEKSAIALAATISNTRVLEKATPNYTPVRPAPNTIRLMAIAIGLMLPALVIFVLELLNDKVSNRHDVERLTGATILGEVGHSFAEENLVVKSRSRSVVAEQFRIIRSNLQYVLNHVERPVLLVTSSFSGEGKSFISTNMGAVMALAGKRTIILEFDIRKPKILSHLNMTSGGGLTNYLLGKVSLESLPVPVPDIDKLFVLPCGPIPPNPSELLLDPKFNDLFQWLRQNFDVVVMDTAPVGMVSDALTLSKFADATLYIVRQGHTFKKQIGLIEDYRQGKLPKVNVVLNDVKLQSGYGYYGQYGYGKAYGSGYFEDETPPVGFLGRWFGWAGLGLNGKKKTKKAEA